METLQLLMQGHFIYGDQNAIWFLTMPLLYLAEGIGPVWMFQLFLVDWTLPVGNADMTWGDVKNLFR